MRPKWIIAGNALKLAGHAPENAGHSWKNGKAFTSLVPSQLLNAIYNSGALVGTSALPIRFY